MTETFIEIQSEHIENHSISNQLICFLENYTKPRVYAAMRLVFFAKNTFANLLKYIWQLPQRHLQAKLI